LNSSQHGQDAKRTFEKYDSDMSGTIDPDELEDALFDLGIRLTTENIAAVRKDCGAKSATDLIGFRSFLKWWEMGPKKLAETRQSKLDNLAKEVRTEYLPWIQHLFSAADEDANGTLDREEFAQFYPTLCEYMDMNDGVKLPKLAAALSPDGCLPPSQDAVALEDFEDWFLRIQLKKAKEGAKALDTIKSAKIDIKGLMGAFGPTVGKKKKKGGAGATVVRKTITEQFNYAAVDFSALAIFEKFDVDGSSTISAHELEDMMFELGIKVSKKAMEKARTDLGIKKYSGEVDYFTFEQWWEDGFGAKASVKAQMLGKLSEKMRSDYLPFIKTMFAEADVDKSGELDRDEFQVFYPKLRDYLGKGHSLAPITQCMNEIDSHSEHGGVFGNGLVEYEEFESWFLSKELERAQAASNSSQAVAGGLGGSAEM
jgi:Ca2+-binding EF-hand superfamily protein